ncbi:MAG: 2-amino-4-hydroxy-6-hydroxymethyldihydropteridine diphosphokinase [Paludibacteraceae bacterium]|jgi:2-amino-4-hydroxy-6-hydroxymethyldihydropteridine diphosphokinase|nr:2-amino-4-hydroxy-6-hydroxymethyldihydropteridine diphosphokinase [Paludibacteraceae bacterium]MBQ6733045.1 2-amino-4-hydroxy-6-hydroxymethyldihydropteridine diphosphokinase [Paludibacteraceae bacterium]
MTLSASVQTNNSGVEVFLSLGSNLGDRSKNLESAISLIGSRAGDVTAVSSFIETKPVGFKSENRFVNCAVRIVTALDPFELLRITQQIERELGRTTKSVGGVYSDRTIDIDILLYGNAVIDTPELKIPHPQMRKRDFVMRPLKEITYK